MDGSAPMILNNWVALKKRLKLCLCFWKITKILFEYSCGLIQ